MFSSGLLRTVDYIVLSYSKPRVTTHANIKDKGLCEQMSSIIFNFTYYWRRILAEKKTHLSAITEEKFCKQR